MNSSPAFSKAIYRNNLKNRDCGKEAPQNCDSERATIAQGQGASENRNFEVKPTQPNPDSSGYFGIPSKNWNLKFLFFWHLLGALLFASLFWPVSYSYWEKIDVAFFKMINSSLKERPTWQLFWACANHKIADWVEDLCILGFFIAYIRQAKPLFRLRRVCELIFCVLYIAAVIYLVNELLFRENLKILRLSPTSVVEDSIRLSKEIPWMKVKDISSKSFPGDHGTTAILFAASFSFLAGWRLGVLACLYAVFLCMPRMITGAHWLSDIVVGSGTIAMIVLSWAFCSPLWMQFTENCERLLKRVFRIRNK